MMYDTFGFTGMNYDNIFIKNVIIKHCCQFQTANSHCLHKIIK